MRPCYELWIMRCSISVRPIFFVGFSIIYRIGNLFGKSFAPSMNTFLLAFHQCIQRIKEYGLNTIFSLVLAKSCKTGIIKHSVLPDPVPVVTTMVCGREESIVLQLSV